MGLNLNHMSASAGFRAGSGAVGQPQAIAVSGAMYFQPVGKATGDAMKAGVGFRGHTDAAYIFSGSATPLGQSKSSTDSAVFLGDVIISGSLSANNMIDTDGTGTAHELAIFSDANTIKGDAKLTYNSSTDKLEYLGGQFRAEGQGSSSAIVLAASGTASNSVRLQSAGSGGGVHIEAESTTGKVTIKGDHGTATAVHIDANEGVGSIVDVDAGVFDLDARGLAHLSGSSVTLQAGDGNINLESSGGTLNLGAAANANAINIGTGAAARTISVGNESGATALDLDAGTGGVTIDAQGAGTIAIGTQTDTGAINIGVGASARTITVGNDSSTKVDVNAAAIELDAGASGFAIDGAGNSTLSTSGTGTLTIDSAGALVIDTDGTDNISVGVEAAAKTITVGNDASTKVDVNALAVELDAGASGMVLDSAGLMSLTGSAAAGVQILASNAAGKAVMRGQGGAEIGDDTEQLVFDGSGNVDFDAVALDIDASGLLSLTGSAAGGVQIAASHSSGKVEIRGAGGASVGDDTEALVYDGSGNVDFDAVALDVDASGLLSLTGSHAAGVQILASNAAGQVLIRGAGGSLFGDDTGSVAFSGAGAVSSTGLTTVDIQGSSNVTIDSSAGELVLGGDANTGNVKLGSAGARTVTIGNNTGATALDIDAGSGGVNIDSTAAVTIGGTAATSVVVGRTGQTVTINGNLDVEGTTTTVDSANLTIQDSIIGLGMSGSGTFNNVGDRAIIFARGANAHDALPALSYDGTTSKFELGNYLADPSSGSMGDAASFADLKLRNLELVGGLNLPDLSGNDSLVLKANLDELSQDTDLHFRLLNSLGSGGAELVVSGNLTVEAASRVNQDLTTDATVQFSKVQIDSSGDHIDVGSDGMVLTAAKALTGSAAIDILLDAGGDIILDAAGNDIEFKSGGTSVFKLSKDSNNAVLQPQITDADIVFKEDGGDVVMTVDSSAKSLLLDSTNKIELAGTGNYLHQRTSNVVELLSPTVEIDGATAIKLQSDANTIGRAAGDVTMTFDGLAADGVFAWKDGEDYFEYSDDILMAGTEKIQFTDTGVFINSSENGQLDLVADGAMADAVLVSASAGGITLDANLDIELNADGGDVFMKDGSATGCQFTTVANTSFELAVTGDMILDPTGNHVLPGSDQTDFLGSDGASNNSTIMSTIDLVDAVNLSTSETKVLRLDNIGDAASVLSGDAVTVGNFTAVASAPGSAGVTFLTSQTFSDSSMGSLTSSTSVIALSSTSGLSDIRSQDKVVIGPDSSGNTFTGVVGTEAVSDTATLVSLLGLSSTYDGTDSFDPSDSSLTFVKLSSAPTQTIINGDKLTVGTFGATVSAGGSSVGFASLSSGDIRSGESLSSSSTTFRLKPSASTNAKVKHVGQFDTIFISPGLNLTVGSGGVSVGTHSIASSIDMSSVSSSIAGSSGTISGIGSSSSGFSSVVVGDKITVGSFSAIISAINSSSIDFTDGTGSSSPSHPPASITCTAISLDGSGSGSPVSSISSATISGAALSINTFTGSTQSDPSSASTKKLTRKGIQISSASITGGGSSVTASGLDYAVKTGDSAVGIPLSSTGGSDQSSPDSASTKTVVRSGTDLGWAGLFLSAGDGSGKGKIDFNAGDVTITHSTNALAFAGGSSGYSFDALIKPASDNAVDLGTASLRFRNIFTGDLNLQNDRGDWTLIEENDFISFRNNKTGRRFRMIMEDITGLGNYGPGNDGEM